MALNTAQLKTDIIELLTETMKSEETDFEKFAEKLANMIEKYVKTAQINYTSGLVAPNGAVTGTFNGNIS
jgi:hypothetical protein